MSLDRQSPIPLWYQVKQDILESITTGSLKPGDELLAEAELERKYDLSRYTIRQALQELTREGWLRRGRGRRSMVTEAKTPLSMTWQLVGFIEDMQSRGHSVRARILSQSLELPPSDVVLDLNMRPNKQVVLIHRICTVDEGPFCVDCISVRHDLCPDLLEHDLEDKCLYSFLADEYGISVDRTKRTLKMAFADGILAEALGMELGNPVFLIRDVAYTAENRPILVSKTFIKNKSEFVFDLHSSDIDRPLPFDPPGL